MIKRNDVAKTPLERAIAAGVLPDARVASLEKITKMIRPSDLSRRISALAAELEKVSITKAPTPIRRINRSFKSALHPEVFNDSTNRRSRRY